MPLNCSLKIVNFMLGEFYNNKKRKRKWVERFGESEYRQLFYKKFAVKKKK